MKDLILKAAIAFFFGMIIFNKCTAQVMTLHNANIVSYGADIRVNGDIEGFGVIDLKLSDFRAEKISCDITVIEDRFTISEYIQNCLNNEIFTDEGIYDVYALNKAYLGRFYSYKAIFESYLKHRDKLTLIIKKDGWYFKKIIIN